MSEYEIGLYRIIGDMLREKRNEKELTLEQVADKINVIPKTLQRYETGERKVKISTLMELATILGFDYYDFMAEAKYRLAITEGEPIIVKENTSSYYTINEEARKIAQEIFDDEDMKLLFDLKKTAKADELMNYAKFLKKQYESENNL